MTHQNMMTRFARKVYKETEEIYILVEKHVGIVNGLGDPEDKTNVFGRALYDIYPDFMPVGLNERQKNEWMEKLGEASTYARGLETVFKRHLDCSKTVTKFILHREIGSRVMEAAQRTAGLYDPPPSHKVLAAVRNQLIRWRHDDVTSDDNVSNSSVIARALQLREDMATLLRNRNSYDRDAFPRICKETYASLRDDTRAFVYGQRLALAAQENMIKISRRNMAIFILIQMSNYNENTLTLIRTVLEKATFHAYTDKLISLEVLNKAARGLPYSEVIREQARQERDPTEESGESIQSIDSGSSGEIQGMEESTPDTSQNTVTSTDDVRHPAPEGSPLVEEVIVLKSPTFEILDPVETFRQPRAFTRPPPKAGRKRTYLSVPKMVAKQKCDEEIKEREEREKREQQQEESAEVAAGPEEPKKKRAKRGRKKCRKGKKTKKE